jgi:hypothetical protein
MTMGSIMFSVFHSADVISGGSLYGRDWNQLPPRSGRQRRQARHAMPLTDPVTHLPCGSSIEARRASVLKALKRYLRATAAEMTK